MQNDSNSSILVVLESTRCLIAESLDIDTALTILGLMSEDPSTWDEAMSVWPRYSTPVVCDFPSSLPLEEYSRDQVVQCLSAADAWLVIDMVGKRVFLGGLFPNFGRDAVLTMGDDDSRNPDSTMSIHLPPWWEYHEDASINHVERERQTPIRKPYVQRDVLFGEPFLADIASRIIRVVRTPRWQQLVSKRSQECLYELTVDVHREWLMTPRADLQGRMPRELLHGAMEWSNVVTWGQQLRHAKGKPMVAVPDEWDGYATAPMGSQEMCIYFDLCREVIEAGWYWCQTEKEAIATCSNDSIQSQLVSFLDRVKEEWLNSPFEEGSPPSFVIECDRRRVPRGSGVPIQGMDGIESEHHIPDCDCPICAMMADGVFGTGFTSIDGHHLELDDEFAFSMFETREQWEEERIVCQDFALDSDGLGDEIDADMEMDTNAMEETDDPFASAWTGIKHDGPIPGDRGGYLKMAFMIAEIGMALKSSSASIDEVRQLNAAFADYRQSGTECAESAANLQALLQSLSHRYPELVSKSADLQSYIDENTRALASNQLDPDDYL